MMVIIFMISRPIIMVMINIIMAILTLVMTTLALRILMQLTITYDTMQLPEKDANDTQRNSNNS